MIRVNDIPVSFVMGMHRNGITPVYVLDVVCIACDDITSDSDMWVRFPFMDWKGDIIFGYSFLSGN
jgi:hypothetical protein